MFYLFILLFFVNNRSIGSNCGRHKILWNTSVVVSFDARVEGLACLVRNAVAPLWISSSADLNWNGKLALIVPVDVTGAKRLLLVTLDTALGAVESPVLEQRAEVFARLDAQKAAAELIEGRSRGFESITSGLIISGSESGDVEITGDWKVGTLRISSLVVDEDVAFNRHDWQPFIDVAVDDLQEQVDELGCLIDSLEKKLQDAVLNGTHQPVHFEALDVDGSVLAETLTANQLILERLNDQPFDDLVADVVRRHTERLIEGVTTLAGKLTTASLTADQVNQVTIRDLVTIFDSEIHIEGDIQVLGPASINGPLSVSGPVAGVDVTDQMLWLQDMYPLLNFTEPLVVEELTVYGLLSNVTMDQNFFDSILIDDVVEAQLSGTHRFDHLVVDGDLSVSESVCGLDWSELSDVVRLDGDELITGTKKFVGDIILEQSLLVDLLNELQVPEGERKSSLKKSYHFTTIKMDCYSL